MDDSSENPLSGGEKRLQPSGVGPHSYTPEGVKKFVSPCRNGLASDCPPFFSRGDLLQALPQFFHTFPPVWTGLRPASAVVPTPFTPLISKDDRSLSGIFEFLPQSPRVSTIAPYRA